MSPQDSHDPAVKTPETGGATAPAPRDRRPGNFPVVLTATLLVGAYWGLYYIQRGKVYPGFMSESDQATIATEPGMGVGPSVGGPRDESSDPEGTPPKFLLMSREMAEAVIGLGITPEPNVTELPHFAATSLDGSTFDSSSLRGKPVFINIWATWCTECEKEIPVIQRVWDEYRKKGIVILGVNWKEPREKVEAYVKKHGMTFPILLDSDGSIMKKLHRSGTQGVPETYVVDSQSRRLAWLIGPGQWDSPPGRKFLDLLSEGKGFQSGVSYPAVSISPQQMKDILKTDPPGALLIDLRDHGVFDRGHISKWAVSAPPGEFMRDLTKIPYDVPLVLLSDNPDVAQKIAQALAGIGFQNVGALEGGMKAWKGPLTTEINSPGSGDG